MDFSLSPTSPFASQQVTFTATVRGGTSPYSFDWAFGDGNTGTGNPATHSYTALGTFNVSLTVSDGNGQEIKASHGIIIKPLILSADFSFSPAFPVSSEDVTFTASATGGTPPYSFSWDFGDRVVGQGSRVQHKYTVTTRTTFSVVLKVTDISGSIVKVSRSVPVTVPTGSLGNPTPSNPPSSTVSSPSRLSEFNWRLAALLGGNLFMAALALSQVPALRKKQSRKKAGKSNQPSSKA